MIKKCFLVVALFSLFSCEQGSYTSKQVEAESKRANDFFERAFQLQLERSPMFQSYLGIKDDYSDWDDLSDAYAKEDLELSQKLLKDLRDSIDYKALDKQTAVSYDLFVAELQEQINGFKYRHHNYPVNQMFGLHSRVPSFLINIHTITDKLDAEAYASRLEKVPHLFDQLIENLEIREDKGIIAPKFVFARVIDDSKNIASGYPITKDESNPNALFNDFISKIEKLEDLSKEDKTVLADRVKKALISNLKPAYGKLVAFLEGQQQRATTDDGVWKFPEGEAFYNFALEKTTTTKMTPDEIFEVGKSEVERIHGEMKEIMKKVGFKGTLQEFFKFMREDSQFYYPNTDEGREDYLEKAVALIDTMRTRLDKLFITKPKAPMIVKRVEAFREKSAGTAFYNRPSADGSRPGIYYANLYNTKNMPSYQMEALAYHEGIPGHHMQLALAQELEGIPKFRKFGGYTAYIEGWGLYSEFLGKEIGFYSDPYSDFGRLAMELWRSCRLVADVGIHQKKWTREQAIEFYKTNTPDSERDCERMVERHIVMPSQATAYKIGMNKILMLREEAKNKLGDKFDIKEFHDVVLTSGAVPLHVLEKMVHDYIESKS